MTLNILFPVLNEENRLEQGILKTLDYLKHLETVTFKLTIVDNGSMDKTGEISARLCEMHSEVEYIRISERGVGAAFRAGVAENTCDYVGYMDVDLSTDIHHLEEVITLFKTHHSIDVINGSRLNKASHTIGRKWYRNLSSYGLTFLLKLFLQMKATDSICGFKFFKHQVAKELIALSSDEKGWFFIIELLLRAERLSYQVVELPVRWEDDHNTTVHYFKLITNYLIQIKRLFIEFHFKH
ncbi:glycosyltransferase [Fusibacter ferrireducens]|uniref:Glycosyltransferase n=1 Tax=Fusibacter ferrireducens TaxID=2785058 RepID=A0ABR9ZVP3_9FIRM|nr:glycosyltransferase [Fusibacter ferrireducens]MBF4694514.1 glycosyltransferase [Fusibacter ferrireducens]